MIVTLEYPIPMDVFFSLVMPKGAKILTVGLSDGLPQLYVLTDQGKPLEKRNFTSIVTGLPIDQKIAQMTYIGTFRVQYKEITKILAQIGHKNPDTHDIHAIHVFEITK